MDYILLKPNLHILSKYYKFSETPEMYERVLTEGCMVSPASYYNNKNQLKFGGEHLKMIEREFKSLTEKYHLENHYDNLLFLVFNKYILIDELLLHHEEQYAHKNRVKELAGLLLAFKTTSRSKLHSLTLRTNTETVKIADDQLCEWLGKIIIEAIDEEREPLSLFGLSLHQLLRGSDDIISNKEISIELLENTASMKLKAPYIGNKEYLSEFCLFLHPYMINETSIRPDSDTRFSDRQLSFYFETLSLFEMITNEITSTPKDYMRTILMNHIKKNKTDNQGNKPFNS